MLKFARSVNGTWCDPTLAASLAALDTAYHPDWVAARKADGTWFQGVDNATFALLMPSAPPQALVLGWKTLSDYIVGLLGGGTTGRAALGAIIKSCQGSAAGADNYFAVYFQGQTVFTKPEFMAALNDVAVGIVSAAQKSAVSNNWPQG